jgi:hypothetical protein
MKKAVYAAVLVLALVLAVPAAAFELSGELWSVSEQEFIPEGQLTNIYRAELTLMQIGPVRLMGVADYGGKPNHITDFIDLIRDDLDDEKLADLDDFYILGGLDGKVRVDWPVLGQLDIITSVGYRVLGNVSKAETGIDGGLYGGIEYSAGLGIDIAPGLRLSGVYEYAPSLITLVGEEDQGKVEGIDISIEYQIPLVLAKAGYRSQFFELEEAQGHRISGFYVGAGIHF